VEGRRLKLGHVLYERYPHDFIRPLLVGVAPFFGGLISLWLIVQTGLFTGGAWWETLLFGYLILTITANMFSSKQDLIDIGYLIPLSIIIVFLYYLFPIQTSPLVMASIGRPLTHFFYTIHPPLLFSLGIHGILVLLLTRFK
jgi:hypothetical protein